MAPKVNIIYGKRTLPVTYVPFKGTPEELEAAQRKAIRTLNDMLDEMDEEEVESA